MSTLIPPLIVIVGETASGKSGLAMELAKRFDGELICADSWTVYKGFDIGSAKPTATETAAVRHHLLDVADPADGYSAAIFQRMAQATIKDISARGKMPILVGGTGLYIDSVLFDYGFLPPPLAALRTELNALSLEELIVRCTTMGLDITGIDLHNKRRVIRLIENQGVRPSRTPARANTLVLGLQVPPDELRSRIESRVDDMIDRGLEHEACSLACKYGWDNEAMKGIGYAEWQGYAAGMQSIHETKDLIVAHTLNLAKRQRTWFKRNKSIQWLTDRDKLSEAVAETTTFLYK